MGDKKILAFSPDELTQWQRDGFVIRENIFTPEDNDCIYVISGSHRRAIVGHDELEVSRQSEFRLARDVDDREGVPVPVPSGGVIWFHCHRLHKSTDNHSTRYLIRRSYVAHYLREQAEWINFGRSGRRGQPIMRIRGETLPDRVHEVE